MSVFTQLVKSLYSPKDMALFRFQKIGKTILYIMLLCLIATIPKTFTFGNFTQDVVSTVHQSIEKDLPDFKIENGELHADVKEPIIKEDGNFVFVFDPNATDTTAYANKQGVFVLKDKVVSINNNQTQSQSYSDFGNGTFEKKDIKDIISAIDSIYPILMLVVGIVIYLFQLFISFLGVTILAFIGSAMGGQRKLSYKQVWTLTAYSYTIPTIFFMIMDLLKINVPWSFLLYTAIILIVLYLTIKEIPKPKEKHEL
ncbi:DUF1189 domain-containing protein [Bacillus pseudomycoides]|uniref:DUF1189 domain-containing protein n=1 Tax=Bacillus pseudomycoides TaxID=64104 RepID=A0AAJ1Z306_9BACI|nr:MULTISPECIES: DUF1189 domain-containing protein [Bacillus]EEM04077.1 hypothetical protein bmyco0002_35200 [Bacillus pseudomycoides]EEM09651.1 hypothetical protein bmyco0003_36270 [Bacillus pseudomycoides]KFN16955.1 hypothetical protein DJ94_118 [Bacillus pseudomycoides]MBD5799265.1 hypothetical protein [Bacillus pseudomycoides]MCR8857004.1 DUF1189 domain-containing protein [Bacillus pseudomycoides]